MVIRGWSDIEMLENGAIYIGVSDKCGVPQPNMPLST